MVEREPWALLFVIFSARNNEFALSFNPMWSRSQDVGLPRDNGPQSKMMGRNARKGSLAAPLATTIGWLAEAGDRLLAVRLIGLEIVVLLRVENQHHGKHADRRKRMMHHGLRLRRVLLRFGECGCGGKGAGSEDGRGRDGADGFAQDCLPS